MFLVSDYLTLLRYDGANISIVQTHSEHTVYNYGYDIETGLIWASIPGVKNYRILAWLKIVDERIVLEKDFDVKNTGDTSDETFYVKQNTLRRISFVVPSDRTYTEIRDIKCTVSEDGELNIGSYSTVGHVSDNYNAKGIRAAYKVENRLYFTAVEKDFGSQQRSRAHFFMIEISDTITVTDFFNTSLGYSNLSKGFLFSDVVEKNGKCFVLVRNKNTGGSYQYSDPTGTMLVFDIGTQAKTEIKLSDILTLGDELSSGRIAGFLTENLLLVNVSNHYFLLEYQWDMAQMRQYSNTVEMDFSNGGVWFVKPTSNVALLNTLGKAVNFTIEGTVLFIGEDQKIIQPYDESIGSIGLARNSGKAGDVIEVYVPRK